MTPERFAKLKQVLDRRQPDLTVLTDELHKSHNIAAIQRSCDAVGIPRMHAVSPDMLVRRHHGISSGSRKWVQMELHPTMGEAVSQLKAQGMAVYAAHWSDRAIDYRQADYTRPCAILMGTELAGISKEAAGLADQHLTIPMIGMVESLNVSVAAAIILYEAMRQRERAGLYATPRLPPDDYQTLLFEWAHPAIARRCRGKGLAYPPLTADGDLAENPF